MSLHDHALLAYLQIAETFEHERQIVLSWSHDAFRRVLRENKPERPYLRAARHAAPKGLVEYIAVIYLHERRGRRLAHAAAVLARADSERYHALRARRASL